jgi:predicted phage-related endonuclease
MPRTLRYESEAEWLALRDRHVGGSDVAALFNEWRLPDGSTRILHVYEAPPEGSIFIECQSPYKSSFALWHEKAGLVRESFEETERVRAGKHLEPALASWAQETWPDWKLRKVRRYLQHDEEPGWGASLDYEAVEKGHPPVEFKNVDWLIFRDNWQGDGDDLIPPIHVNLQLQSQIGVSRADHGWVVVCVGGNKLKRVRIEQHQPTQDRIREAVAMFWQGVREGAVPTWLATYDTVCNLALAVRDDDKKIPAVDLCDDEAACRDIRRYERWKAHADFVGMHLDMMKARVGLRLTDRTKALTPTHTISWPLIEREAKTIPARFQDAKTYRGGFTVKRRKEATI